MYKKTGKWKYHPETGLYLHIKSDVYYVQKDGDPKAFRRIDDDDNDPVIKKMKQSEEMRKAISKTEFVKFNESGQQQDPEAAGAEEVNVQSAGPEPKPPEQEVKEEDLRQEGKVTKWDSEKGFGFVAPTDGSAKKIYCHVTDLVDGQVDKGDEVSFDKWYDERRGDWRGHHVKVAHGDQRVGHDRKEGTIKSWDSEKGFGFVEPSGGGKKIFCHFRDLVGGNYGSSSSSELVGERVTYEEEFNKKAGKYKCTEVSIVSDGVLA